MEAEPRKNSKTRIYEHPYHIPVHLCIDRINGGYIYKIATGNIQNIAPSGSYDLPDIFI
ncbi:MAG TPA: hypothetical protein PLN76_02630 [Saprospiraceae bacterium]|nr:hypothetical protein [Saprospiraceae bacterium]